MENTLLTVEELALKYSKKLHQIRYTIDSNDIQPIDASTRPLRFDEEDYLKAVGAFKTTALEELQKLGTQDHPTLGLKVGDLVSYEFLTDRYWSFSSGISFLTKEPDVTLVITKIDSKEKKQYEDYFDGDEGVLKYFGEGQVGDMSLQSKGNRRLFNHIKTKKEVDVYQKKAVKQYIFLGRFTVIDVNALKAPDTEGNNRLAYIFSLKPLVISGLEMNVNEVKEHLNLTDLFQRLENIQKNVSGDKDSGKAKEKVTTGYKRSRELVEAFKAWYGYRCQLCNPKNPIPRIEMKNGRFYVEVHHCTGMAEAMNIPPGGTQEEGDFLVDHYNNLLSTCCYHHMTLHHYKYKFIFDKDQQAFIAKDGTTLPIYILHKEHKLGN